LENREIPEDFSTRQRKEFLEIANRAKVELNASFSLVAIGLQLYLESAKLAARVPPPEPAPAHEPEP
jgi:hypothetical protein